MDYIKINNILYINFNKNITTIVTINNIKKSLNRMKNNINSMR